MRWGLVIMKNKSQEKVLLLQWINKNHVCTCTPKCFVECKLIIKTYAICDISGTSCLNIMTFLIKEDTPISKCEGGIE